ncbi:hypothetical protein SDJN03_08081, partial [Cucurbita argyrosperma subsp. sororia]
MTISAVSTKMDKAKSLGEKKNSIKLEDMAFSTLTLQKPYSRRTSNQSGFSRLSLKDPKTKSTKVESPNRSEEKYWKDEEKQRRWVKKCAAKRKVEVKS